LGAGIERKVMASEWPKIDGKIFMAGRRKTGKRFLPCRRRPTLQSRQQRWGAEPPEQAARPAIARRFR
jgi:hypothetical protein